MSDNTSAWDTLDINTKAWVIEQAVRGGISKDLGEIKQLYNQIDSLNNVAIKQNPNIIQRLNQDNVKTIPDWKHQDRRASHKMGSYGNRVIGIVQQDSTGNLIDHSNPINHKGSNMWDAAIKSAEQNKDYVEFSNPEHAGTYGQFYKLAYPQHFMPTKKYDGGGFLNALKSWAKQTFNMESFSDRGKFEDLNSKDKEILLSYAKKLNLTNKELENMYDNGHLMPFIHGKIDSNFKYEVRENDSPTSKVSTDVERKANASIYNTKGGVSPNMRYAIPYIEDKEIKVPGVGRVSTNALDSIAKYAQIAGISVQDAIGLAAQETNFGASLWANMKQPKKGMTEKQKQDIKEHNRAIGNMSYFRNAGIIPAEHLVRDFRYNISEDPISRDIPPLLHAFEYFKSGNYNRGDKNHTSDVKSKGKKVFATPEVKEWWENSEFNSKNKK